MRFKISEKTYAWLIPALFLTGLGIILNPRPSFDILLAALAILMLGQAILKDNLILLFLLLRPALDLWRDLVLFEYQDFAVNLNAALALVMLLWLLSMLYKYRHSVRSVPPMALFALMSGLMFASAFYSVSKITTLVEAAKFLNIVCIFAVSYLLIKEKKLSKQTLLITLIVSALIPLSLALYQLFTGSGISTFGLRGRIHGSFAHPNVFAFFTLSFLFIQIQYSALAKHVLFVKYKYLDKILYTLLAILLLFTYTRAAWIGLAVFLFVLGIVYNTKLLHRFILGIALSYALFFAINSVLIHYYDYSLREIPLVERLTGRNEDADSLAWRQALVRETLPIIRARPYFGFGYGTFPTVWEENRSLGHLWDDSAEAHNDYLRMALEIGLIGLALYILLLISLIALVFRLFRREARSGKRYQYLCLLAWLISFAVLSFSDNMLHHTPVIWLTASWWGASLARPVSHDEPNFV
ncbi:MAG: O-antigen ligase family protein [Candidatus Magasanikbacteria bacterium]|nr:O-antigen ligase family protein [Candidatus Magasanikbacteria bacterium]